MDLKDLSFNRSGLGSMDDFMDQGLPEDTEGIHDGCNP